MAILAGKSFLGKKWLDRLGFRQPIFQNRSTGTYCKLKVLICLAMYPAYPQVSVRPDLFERRARFPQNYYLQPLY